MFEPLGNAAASAGSTCRLVWVGPMTAPLLTVRLPFEAMLNEEKPPSSKKAVPSVRSLLAAPLVPPVIVTALWLEIDSDPPVPKP